MRLKKYLSCLCACAFVYSLHSFAEVSTVEQSNQIINKEHIINFDDYVTFLAQEAKTERISNEIIKSEFSSIQFIPHVVEAHHNQPEKGISTQQYLQNVLPSEKIKIGEEAFLNNQALVTEIGHKYGVQPEYLVAFWGLESTFGRIQGKEDILSALATLAFQGHREAFFKAEFFDALRILEKNYATREELTGSWAGAMGQLQFIPSSLLMYGQDWNQDGKIDIWHDKADVFASIANFLATKQWDAQLPWGQEVTLKSTDSFQALSGLEMKKAKTFKEWKVLGISLTRSLTEQQMNQKAWLIIADQEPLKAFLVTKNFKIILHWNNSNDFALSVGLFADQIALADKK